MTSSVFKLVPDAVSHSTKQCLEELTQQAESRELIGIAYVAMYRGRRFIVNSAGEAHRNPTFARGMLSVLDDQFAQMIWEGIDP